MKHTATPWTEVHGRWVIPSAHAERRIGGSTDKVKDHEDYAACICITGDNPNRFAEGEPEANAAFIVRACNSHDQLVAALKKAQEDINWMLNSQQFLNGFVFKYIDEALEAAGDQS